MATAAARTTTAATEARMATTGTTPMEAVLPQTLAEGHSQGVLGERSFDLLRSAMMTLLDVVYLLDGVVLGLVFLHHRGQVQTLICVGSGDVAVLTLYEQIRDSEKETIIHFQLLVEDPEHT
uniref:Uncharacterized protein n=1 Tax=Oryza brachyantha TaxID=4533 RepID=J3MTP1_ORYBR